MAEWDLCMIYIDGLTRDVGNNVLLQINKKFVSKCQGRDIFCWKFHVQKQSSINVYQKFNAASKFLNFLDSFFVSMKYAATHESIFQ